MKKLLILLFTILAVVILPMGVYAEEESDNTQVSEESSETSDSKEVKLYFFRGEGCPHCTETEEWLESIEDEYGEYFEVIDYETWKDKENNELMERVADARGETLEGVPYIIVGNKSWMGFTDSYKEEILSEIQSEYKKDVSSRYDIMKLLPTLEAEKKSKSSDVAALILIIIAVGAIVGGVIYSRNHTN